ncbi:phytanoyl-CoA dioxygenase family protein [Roseibium suaedae]|uniref:Phytanoyl-CoA dioxygenase (PhyH) n=1 Tax=Roseibium suaedae TaxID=735517 RepID=A0A1M7GZT6_9HYPH|nr:phytanoyl-CoA dioxygenase family protein [Roseibium suaedae]SHM21902.1 Phytanoyl-CoA dioxygenase (PhyH) [Roseibium suaedae]
MRAIDILKAPLWAASLASGAKSFKDNPLIGSTWLNERGLHEKRLMTAERMSDFRRSLMRRMVSKEHAEAYQRDGYVIVRDVLPPEAFEQLKHEVIENAFAAQEMLQGNAVTRFTPITRKMIRELPEFGALVTGPLFQGLLRYVGSWNADPITFIHTVFAEPDRGPRDPQTVFHSDTFQPTSKCWYFLSDVPEDGGPFTYVPGSHRMTPERLAWEREQALSASSGARSMHSLGSFRITDEELATLGYRAPVKVAVPANTLVVADTHGFHARGLSLRPTVRLGIYGSLRRNPFAPLPGLDVFNIPGLRWRQAEIHDAVNNWKMRTGRPTGQPGVGEVKPLDPPRSWNG